MEASVPEHVFIQTLFEYLVWARAKGGGGEGGGDN